MGYVMNELSEKSDDNPNEQRTEPLREIILARALFRCGDYQGLGRQILEAYQTDLRGLFAKHAHAVLLVAPSQEK